MRLEGRILVTGADGFIGSHLVEALLDSGHAVPNHYQASIWKKVVVHLLMVLRHRTVTLKSPKTASNT
jgi:uncharacterized protein YbjT (DUF2867 family)